MLEVKAENVESFEIIIQSNKVVRLDEDFPAFGIRFLDKNGHRVRFTEKFRINIKSENGGLKIGTKFQKGVVDNYNADKDGNHNYIYDVIMEIITITIMSRNNIPFI